jgi:flagellar hook protein FlgE
VLRTSAEPTDIILPMYSKDPAKATQNIEFKCNLYSEMAIVENFDELPQNEQLKNSWTSSINVYDNYGTPLEARFTFVKTAVNQWEVRSEVFRIDPENPETKIRLDDGEYNLDVNPTAGGGTEGVDGQTRFTMNFDNMGRIRSVTDQAGDVLDEGAIYVSMSMNIPSADPALENQRMQFNINLGEAGRVKTEEGVGVTQFSSDFTTKPFRQDGYAMGYMEDIKVDDTGAITGVFSNGNNRTLAQVALANFTNPGGLEKVGQTNFVYSNNSGLPDISPAGTIGKGKIVAGALEMSNVDLSEQFVDMIVTQRGFQANSKIIQTTDQLLQELLTLKR